MNYLSMFVVMQFDRGIFEIESGSCSADESSDSNESADLNTVYIK